jgi:hypothetical protein
MPGIIEELRGAGLEIQRIDAILIRNPRRRADPDGLLRHVVYLGEREDKPAEEYSAAQAGGLDPRLGAAAVGATISAAREPTRPQGKSVSSHVNR